MSRIIRGEQWTLSYGGQFFDDGSLHSGVETADRVVNEDYMGNIFGIFSSASLPDPNFDFTPHWAYGTASKRNWYIQYKGKAAFSGSIGDITLLNGNPLYLPIGYCKTTGTDVGGGGGSTLNGAVSRGAIQVTVNDGSNYSNSDYIQIGTGDNAEVRQISSGGGTTTLVLNYPLLRDHANVETCNEVEAPFTHTSIEADELLPIQIDATYVDTDGNDSLQRRYVGCKVGRASISASQEGVASFSLDDIQARDMRYVDKDSTNISPWYTTDIVKPTISCPTTEPYYFSYGELSLAGTTFARITDFKLDISNSLEPKYYITDDVGSHRVPYEILEGRKEYTMGVTVDIEDASLFFELLRQGDYSSVYKGFQAIMTFTRGSNDTITITTPPSAPAAGGDAMGCLIRTAPHNIVDSAIVGVSLDISCRSVQVVTVDSVAVTP